MGKRKRLRNEADRLRERLGLEEEVDELRAALARRKRPMGFQPPKSVTVGYIHPRGIETQAWEEWQ